MDHVKFVEDSYNFLLKFPNRSRIAIFRCINSNFKTKFIFPPDVQIPYSDGLSFCDNTVTSTKPHPVLLWMPGVVNGSEKRIWKGFASLHVFLYKQLHFGV